MYQNTSEQQKTLTKIQKTANFVPIYSIPRALRMYKK